MIILKNATILDRYSYIDAAGWHIEGVNAVLDGVPINIVRMDGDNRGATVKIGDGLCDPIYKITSKEFKEFMEAHGYELG